MEDRRLENTPQNDLYEDELQNKQSFPQLTQELESMPEVEDHYTGAEIMLPRGDKIARGQVMAQSHDVDRNSMGRANTNPTLDTRMYQVEFAVGNVTELTVNVIAESKYV